MFFKNFWLYTKKILFYPLFSIGQSPVSLATFFKIGILLFICVYLLKKIRTKTVKILIKNFNISSGVVNSLTTLGYYTFLVIIFLIILSTAGINLSQLTIILSALGVGIGFGLQSIVNNFVSGIILLLERTIKVGDFVELEDGVIGEIKEITMRTTVIKTFDGNDIIVPNSELISNRVNTWTYLDKFRRIHVPFGVSYDSDPEIVKKAAIEAAREVKFTIEDEEHPIVVVFKEFGDSSINFVLLVWCEMSKAIGDLGISEYYFALFRKFKEYNIEIPFPQLDIHIK